MKDCKCGKKIDERWEMCFDCFEESKQEQSMTKQSSIERQVAAKCTAKVFDGRPAQEEEITKAFNLFLKLIRE